jgi:hypothetical protein
MKMPSEHAAVKTRKKLPARKARKPSLKKVVPKKIARRKRVLKRGSDEELIRVFGEK